MVGVIIIFCIFVYLVGAGFTAGLTLYVSNGGKDLCYVDGDEIFINVLLGLFWPITLTLLLCYKRLVNSHGNEDE